MKASFNNIMIYAKDIEKTAEFYVKYFGFKVVSETLASTLASIKELAPDGGGSTLLIHQAGKAMKMGQVCIKLVFSVSNVEKFKVQALKKGVKFGVTHEGLGYYFANAKDPSKNNVQITSRRSSKNA